MPLLDCPFRGNSMSQSVVSTHPTLVGKEGKEGVEKVSEQLLEKSWSVKGSLSVFDPAFKAFQEWLRQGSKKLVILLYFWVKQ